MRTMRKTMMVLLALTGSHLAAQEYTTPAPVPEILAAIPFQLEEAYVHHWRAERPKVTSGYILVLEVVPFRARQVAEPVLYVGKQTAERINSGEVSGHVIALVPGNTSDPNHPDYIDLTRDLVWFGHPDLPERIDGSKIENQYQLARDAAFTPFSRATVNEARETGGEAVQARSKVDMLGILADLLATYAPDEEALIASYRLPRR